MKKINLTVLTLFVTSLFLNLNAQDQKARALITSLEETIGGWDNLYAKQNVMFTYEYLYPEPGIKDLSVEKYIFEGEKSYAHYTTHQINVVPKMEGDVHQYYNGASATMKVGDKVITDKQLLGVAQFLRKANYFWFVMNFKFSDPGVVASYGGTKKVGEENYEIVNISYESEKTGKEQNDAYILYINPKTNLVDQFYFSLPFMGVNQPVIKMEVMYETIEGLKLPTKRKIYMPGKDGKLSTKPNLVQTSSNVKFNNDFNGQDLMIK